MRSDPRETARETARGARQIGNRTAQHSIPPFRSDQLFAVHERLNDLTRQLERLHHAPAPHSPYPPPAQGPDAYALPSDNHNRDHQLAEAIARLERRLDQLVNASCDLPAAPVYAPLPASMPEPPAAAPADDRTQDIDQAQAETTPCQQALVADLNAPAFVPPRATESAAPVEPHLPAQPALVPEENLSGLEQHLRDITTQIEALRQHPQVGEIRALAPRLDNSQHADTNTPTSIPHGVAELLETPRSTFSKHNPALLFDELAGQTAIFIAACPLPGAVVGHLKTRPDRAG